MAHYLFYSVNNCFYNNTVRENSIINSSLSLVGKAIHF